jgi:hypothetical protein
VTEGASADTAPRQGLFRQEAVKAHTEAAGPGRLLPSSRRALGAACLCLALTLAAALAGAAVVTVDETAEGTWKGTGAAKLMTLYLPIGALPRLERGQAVRLTVGREHLDAVVTGEPRPASGRTGAAEAHVEARLTDGVLTVPGGRAVVTLDRRRLLGLVGDSLGRGFGRG